MTLGHKTLRETVWLGLPHHGRTFVTGQDVECFLKGILWYCAYRESRLWLDTVAKVHPQRGTRSNFASSNERARELRPIRRTERVCMDLLQIAPVHQCEPGECGERYAVMPKRV